MDNRNRDRGTIKWTAIMLTEHLHLLREWKAEDDVFPEPNLDESDFDELVYQIQITVQTHSVGEFIIGRMVNRLWLKEPLINFR
jgi:hypothetical protein